MTFCGSPTSLTAPGSAACGSRTPSTAARSAHQILNLIGTRWARVGRATRSREPSPQTIAAPVGFPQGLSARHRRRCPSCCGERQFSERPTLGNMLPRQREKPARKYYQPVLALDVAGVTQIPMPAFIWAKAADAAVLGALLAPTSPLRAWRTSGRGHRGAGTASCGVGGASGVVERTSERDPGRNERLEVAPIHRENAGCPCAYRAGDDQRVVAASACDAGRNALFEEGPVGPTVERDDARHGQVGAQRSAAERGARRCGGGRRVSTAYASRSTGAAKTSARRGCSAPSRAAAAAAWCSCHPQSAAIRMLVSGTTPGRGPTPCRVRGGRVAACLRPRRKSAPAPSCRARPPRACRVVGTPRATVRARSRRPRVDSGSRSWLPESVGLAVAPLSERRCVRQHRWS